MEIVIFIGILGYYVSKVILYSHERLNFGKSDKLQTFFYIVIPFSEYFIRDRQRDRLKITFSTFLGLLSFLIVGASLFDRVSYREYILSFELILFLLFFFVTLFILLTLAIQDLYTYEIRTDFSQLLIFIVILANVVIATANILLINIFQITDRAIFEFANLGTIENLLGFILGYFLIWLLVKLSNEKFIGSGDADILAVIGGTLGVSGLVIALFATSIIGSVVGILYSIKVKQFHGLIIPMVPFLLLGYLIAFGYTEEIIIFLIPTL